MLGILLDGGNQVRNVKGDDAALAVRVRLGDLKPSSRVSVERLR